MPAPSHHDKIMVGQHRLSRPHRRRHCPALSRNQCGHYDNIWLRRIAIDHQLLRKEKTDTTLLAQILDNNLGQNEFFINKAIGWALRDYSKTNPEWVREYIKSRHEKMAALSIKEASKYL